MHVSLWYIFVWCFVLWYSNGFFYFLQFNTMLVLVEPTHPQCIYAEVRCCQLLTTSCCFHAGADEEYIYMNKVIVPGKDKGGKGVSFKRFLSEVWYFVMSFLPSSSWNMIYKENYFILYIERGIMRHLAFFSPASGLALWMAHEFEFD